MQRVHCITIAGLAFGFERTCHLEEESMVCTASTCWLTPSTSRRIADIHNSDYVGADFMLVAACRCQSLVVFFLGVLMFVPSEVGHV